MGEVGQGSGEVSGEVFTGAPLAASGKGGGVPGQGRDLADDARRNVACFLGLRVLMGCRYYYPVFMVLFLDFGLTVAQFSWLNAVWAAVIVLLEVPSGALADLIGRRALVITAVVLMVLEMLVLAVVPVGSTLVLAAFILNRCLSGASEAAASGADEAATFDALRLAGREAEWPRVLERLGYLTSMGSLATVLMGAAIFDPDVWNTVAAWLEDWGLVEAAAPFTKADTVKWPIYLTLVHAVLALGLAWAMREPADRPERLPGWGATLKAGRAAFRQAGETGRWILGQREVWWLLLGGLLLDHLARFSVTISSQYLREHGWAEAALGPLMAVMSLLGLPLARLARWMIERRSPAANAIALAAVTLLAMLGMAFTTALASPWLPRGVLAVLLGYTLFSVMVLVQPLLSTYLNQRAPSAQRATVLSFKGLALNVAYGGFGLLYARLFSAATNPGEPSRFLESLWVLPAYFAVALGAASALALLKNPGRGLMQAPVVAAKAEAS